MRNRCSKRITISKLLLGLFLIYQSSAWANHFPADQDSGSDLEFTTRLFYIKEQWTHLAEISAANQFEDQNYRAVLLGSYFRFHENIRAGLFYKRQYGFRHNSDWVEDPIVAWKWKNTNDRGEDLAIVDLSPRFLLSFLPGTNWTLDLKTRFEYNVYNGNQNLRLIPTLTYYWIRKDRPFLNFYVQHEQTLPLSHESVTSGEEWLYFGLLYHLNPTWQVGLSASKKTMSWKSTPEFTELTGASYSTKNSGEAVGLLVIYKFGN